MMVSSISVVLCIFGFGVSNTVSVPIDVPGGEHFGQPLPQQYEGQYPGAYGGQYASLQGRQYGGGIAPQYGSQRGYGGSNYGTYREEYYPPQPYNFGYVAADELGSAHHRQEEGDGTGSVRGSYGYTDVQGLYRKVNYIADGTGFRAEIQSNEPGLKPENPADVSLEVSHPPAGIQEAYTRYSGYGGAYGNQQQVGGYAGSVYGQGHSGIENQYLSGQNYLERYGSNPSVHFNN